MPCVTKTLQGVIALPDFIRKLSDAVAAALDAAAVDFAADDDFEATAAICCDCLSEIAKACKMASLNRECAIPEVHAVTMMDLVVMMIIAAALIA